MRDPQQETVALAEKAFVAIHKHAPMPVPSSDAAEAIIEAVAALIAAGWRPPADTTEGETDAS